MYTLLEYPGSGPVTYSSFLPNLYVKKTIVAERCLLQMILSGSGWTPEGA